MIPPFLRRLALALLLALALVAGAAADPGDPWWDGDWSARAPLTVTGASATEGVQAQVTVAYDSDMQTDLTIVKTAIFFTEVHDLLRD